VGALSHHFVQEFKPADLTSLNEAIVHRERASQEGNAPARGLDHDELPWLGKSSQLWKGQAHSKVAWRHLNMIDDRYLLLK